MKSIFTHTCLFICLITTPWNVYASTEAQPVSEQQSPAVKYKIIYCPQSEDETYDNSFKACEQGSLCLTQSKGEVKLEEFDLCMRSATYRQVSHHINMNTDPFCKGSEENQVSTFILSHFSLRAYNLSEVKTKHHYATWVGKDNDSLDCISEYYKPTQSQVRLRLVLDPSVPQVSDLFVEYPFGQGTKADTAGTGAFAFHFKLIRDDVRTE